MKSFPLKIALKNQHLNRSHTIASNIHTNTTRKTARIEYIGTPLCNKTMMRMITKFHQTMSHTVQYIAEFNQNYCKAEMKGRKTILRQEKKSELSQIMIPVREALLSIY